MKTYQQIEKELDGSYLDPRETINEVGKIHPRQAEAMKVFESLQKSRRTEISADIKEIAGLLKVDTTPATFPEELFVEHFLPLFSGQIEPTPHLNYSTWIEKVAGGDTISVQIVDEKNNVLFTVPPLLNHSILEQTKPGTQAMTHIERQYSRLKEVDAVGSQQFLSKMLSSMHVKDKPTQEVYDNMRTWNDIFKRYGLEDKIVHLLDMSDDKNKDKTITPEQTAPDTDIGDYELDTD